MITSIPQRGPLKTPRAHKVPQKALIVTAIARASSYSTGGNDGANSVPGYRLSRLDIGDEYGNIGKIEEYPTAEKTLEAIFGLAKRKSETWAFVLGLSSFLRSALAACSPGLLDLTAPVWVDAGTPALSLLTHGGKAVWLADIRNYCELDYRELATDLTPAPALPNSVYHTNLADCTDWIGLHAKVSNAAWSILSYLAVIYPECWSGTAAGVGWNIWLRHFNSEPLICHDCPEAANLESKSLFGGRVECFRLGEVSREVYRLDRTCHYPATAIDSPLPVQLVSSGDLSKYTESPGREDDVSYCAAVEINCNDHCWPCRVNGQPQWVNGSYLTYLCGNELKAALYFGCVKHVRQSFTYRNGYPLRGISTAMMDMRRDAQAKQYPALAALAKRAANGLYGRLLRKERVWEDNADLCPPVAAGEWYHGDPRRTELLRCMTFRGKTRCEVGTRPHDESHLACGGHLLAAARRAMDRFMRIAGNDQIYYLCCDGLHVTRTGYGRLMAKPDLLTSKPGGLRLDGIASCAYYRGIYDYDVGDKSVRAGVPKLCGPDGLPICAGTLRQAELCCDQWDRRDPILVLQHSTGMTKARYEGMVQNDGWIKARTLYGYGLD